MRKDIKQEIHCFGKIFNLGIYNIVTAENDKQFNLEIEKTLSDEGMTFGNSMKYRVDFNINIGNNTTKIQKEFIKAKQIVTVGVASTEKHLGATSLAINLCKFLNEYQNERSCYIENNNHNTIISLNDFKDALYFQEKRKIEYQGVELYERPDSIASIQKYDYSFYIYDYGNFNELSKEERNSFMSRDLKFMTTSSKIWEYVGIVNCLYYLKDEENTYFYVINTNLEDREEFRANFDKDWKSKIFFAPGNSNPFQVTLENREYYRKVFEPYLLNSVIEEKSRGIKGLFNKKKKGK